jgi:hypothetical protein
MLTGQRVFHSLISMSRGARPLKSRILAGGPTRGASNR